MIGSHNEGDHFGCEVLAENGYGTRFDVTDTVANLEEQDRAGRIDTVRDAPAGTLVFSSSTLELHDGHAAVSLGNGQVVNGGTDLAAGEPTVEQAMPTTGYLGRSYAPRGWPRPSASR